MPKKYEKFEEWMVGKTVLWDGNKGVVTREYRGKENCVWADWESSRLGEAWIEIDSLEFLNVGEQDVVDQAVPSEHTPIPWEEGQVVYCLIRGKGQVNDVGRDSVVVWFDKVGAWKYTDKGELLGYEGVRTLFFSEPAIIADTMPPKKSFEPKLKEGDKLMVVGSRGKVEDYGYIEQEFEDSVAMRTGEVYEKAYYSFFKLGEEIKWEA